MRSSWKTTTPTWSWMTATSRWRTVTSPWAQMLQALTRAVRPSEEWPWTLTRLWIESWRSATMSWWSEAPDWSCPWTIRSPRCLSTPTATGTSMKRWVERGKRWPNESLFSLSSLIRSDLSQHLSCLWSGWFDVSTSFITLSFTSLQKRKLFIHFSSAKHYAFFLFLATLPLTRPLSTRHHGSEACSGFSKFIMTTE